MYKSHSDIFQYKNYSVLCNLLTIFVIELNILAKETQTQCHWEGLIDKLYHPGSTLDSGLLVCDI